MGLKEFATYRPRTLAGYSISISPPLGAYENDKLLNVGTNRWTFRNIATSYPPLTPISPTFIEGSTTTSWRWPR